MKRRVAIWIVKQMRKEFDDITILEIVKVRMKDILNMKRE